MLDDESLLWASCSLLRWPLTPAGSLSDPVPYFTLWPPILYFDARACSVVLV